MKDKQVRQEPITFVGNGAHNCDYFDGQLPHYPGASSFQVFRCSSQSETDVGKWTYNHAPMLAYWNGRYLVEYLSNPKHEHEAPGRTLLTLSEDAVHWQTPIVVFPEYRIPNDTFIWHDSPLNNFDAIMHQRMGFYEASNGRLLVIGNYGLSPDGEAVPFGALSIGRVVREVYADFSLGDIYFIYLNKGTIWNKDNVLYPMYQTSRDEGFVSACEELLSSPLQTQQWAEEQGDDDEIIHMQAKDCGVLNNKAFCFYQLPDGRHMGLWKWMNCAVTDDGGYHWSPMMKSKNVLYSGSKIWGQRMQNSRYALIYNPNTFNTYRWPLAIATGADGIHFDHLQALSPVLSPLRYGGGHKNHGFNYMRGIENGAQKGADDALYCVYSINKEDIWITRVPEEVYIPDRINDCFSRYEKTDGCIDGWGVYRPQWSYIKIDAAANGLGNCMKLMNADPYDAALAERAFCPLKKLKVKIEFSIEKSGGVFSIILQDHAGRTPFALSVSPDNRLSIRHGRKTVSPVCLNENQSYVLELFLDVDASRFDILLDHQSLSQGQNYQGQPSRDRGWYFAGSTDAVARLTLCNGKLRTKATGQEDMHHGCCDEAPETDVPTQESVYAVYCLQVTDWSAADAD